MEWLIWFLVSLIVSAVVIWIVGKLGLGMTVSSFGAAFVTALVIAIITAVLTWLLGLLGISLGGPGLLGANVTCFNPEKDPDGVWGARLAGLLAATLAAPA